MEDFKIENFEKEYPEHEFPWFRHLSGHECQEVAKNIYHILGIDKKISTAVLVNQLREKEGIINAFNALDDNFNLLSAFHFSHINPSNKIFVNWYRFDDIDEIFFEDLNKYFHDIWYPGPDDIDIFDKTFSWVLSVSHNGSIFKLSPKAGIARNPMNR